MQCYEDDEMIMELKLCIQLNPSTRSAYMEKMFQ